MSAAGGFDDGGVTAGVCGAAARVSVRGAGAGAAAAGAAAFVSRRRSGGGVAPFSRCGYSIFSFAVAGVPEEVVDATGGTSGAGAGRSCAVKVLVSPTSPR